MFKNPITYKVESYMGASYACLLAAFFGSLIIIAVKNFETDIDIMSATSNTNKVSHVSETERTLIEEWVDRNDVLIPEGKGYRYLINEYPDRPWL
jgi:hypothetical protein